MFTITPSKVNYVIRLCGCIRHSFVRSLCSGSRFIASDRSLAELRRKPARLDNVLIPVSFSSKLLLFIKFEMPPKKLFKPYKDQRTWASLLGREAPIRSSSEGQASSNITVDSSENKYRAKVTVRYSTVQLAWLWWRKADQPWYSVNILPKTRL